MHGDEFNSWMSSIPWDVVGVGHCSSALSNLSAVIELGIKEGFLPFAGFKGCPCRSGL